MKGTSLHYEKKNFTVKLQLRYFEGLFKGTKRVGRQSGTIKTTGGI